MTVRLLGPTHRQRADRELDRLRAALEVARARPGGDPGMIRARIDYWLDYRLAHERAGSLDERA